MDVTSVALCFGDRRNHLSDAVSHLSIAVVGADLRVRRGKTEVRHRRSFSNCLTSCSCPVRVVSWIDFIYRSARQTIHEITRSTTK